MTDGCDVRQDGKSACCRRDSARPGRGFGQARELRRDGPCSRTRDDREASNAWPPPGGLAVRGRRKRASPRKRWVEARRDRSKVSSVCVLCEGASFAWLPPGSFRPAAPVGLSPPCTQRGPRRGAACAAAALIGACVYLTELARACLLEVEEQVLVSRSGCITHLGSGAAAAAPKLFPFASALARRQQHRHASTCQSAVPHGPTARERMRVADAAAARTEATCEQLTAWTRGRSRTKEERARA